MHRESGGIFVIVKGKICMCKHPFGHETLFCESKMEENLPHF